MALHLGAVPDAMEVIVERFAGDLLPGDVIVLNDPYDGGMHLPDIFMFKPIFFEASGCMRLLGGRSPTIATSAAACRAPMPRDSTEIFQEGLRIPPMKLYDAGAPQQDAASTSSRRTSACPTWCSATSMPSTPPARIGEREMLRLFERYGERA